MNKVKAKSGKSYLKSFLRVAPLSHALWRSVEALSFSSVDFKSPVLDLGCGFGEFAGVVFDKLEMGVDINNDDLGQALNGKKYKNLQWADARKLPFRSNSYSTVVSVSVLEHIENVEKVLKEVHRILKKGGIFVFSVPTIKIYNNLLIPKILNSLGQEKAAQKYFELHSRVFKHVDLKSVEWWETNLKKAKFEILRKEGTISPTLLKLHEVFLVSAFPSQVGKLFFGKRFMMSIGLRSNILPVFFSRFVYIDRDSDINMFFVVRKK